MPTFEEMSAWGLEDIESAIHHDLPKGCTFQRGYNEDVAGWASISDAEGKIVWETDNVPDERILLLNVYGWLLSRQTKARHPAWVRRFETTPRPVIGPLSLPGVSIPDPEDLDPTEVGSVYSALHNDPKRR